jgi:hypothetical protein
MTVMTAAFYSTVDANSKKTLVSERINSPFQTRRIVASFALNTARKLRLHFFISPDDDNPTTTYPNGVNLLQLVGQVDYLVGDDEQKDIRFEVPESLSGMWLKVYANNTDNVEHTIDAQIEFALKPRREA